MRPSATLIRGRFGRWKANHGLGLHDVNCPQELVDRMRDAVRLYVKIDLGAFALIVALFGALKLDRSDVFAYKDAISLAVFAVSGLLLFGLLINFALMWLQPGARGKTRSIKPMLVGMYTHWVLHVLFLIVAVFGLIVFLNNDLPQLGERQIRNQLVDRVHEYFLERGDLPVDKKDLLTLSPSPHEFHRRLGTSEFDYKRLDSNHYELILGGRDTLVGTSDDHKFKETFTPSR